MKQQGSIKYHIVWCTKYRRNVLNTEVEKDLKTILSDKCKQRGHVLHEIEVMPDHVHLFLQADHKTTVHSIVAQLKGVTANILRKKYKHLRTRLPSLWTRSYYADTVGHISEDSVRKYIQNQKNI